MRFTYQEKLKCVERELALRKNVYPKLVARRQMRQGQADHELAVLEAIRSDYVIMVKKIETKD